MADYAEQQLKDAARTSIAASDGPMAQGQSPANPMTLEQQRAVALARARRLRAEAEASGQKPAAATPSGFIEAQLYDGTILQFPAGTDMKVINRVAKEQTLKRRQVAAGAPILDTDAAGNPVAMLPPGANYNPTPDTPDATSEPQRTWGDTISGLGASLADGLRQGATMVAGAPVDLVNNAPRLANLLPGVEGVGPMTENPVGGSASLDELLRTISGVAGATTALPIDAALGTNLGGGFGRAGPGGLPIVPDYEPQGGVERVVNRIGQEVGATAVPVGGAIAKAATMPLSTVNRMAAAPKTVGEGVASMFLQPAAVAPGILAGREAGYAVGGGLGAGLANEMAGDNQGVVSDVLGSIAGVGATAGASGLVGAGRNVLAGATNNPTFADDVANSAVAERVINSSTQMQRQAARLAEAGIPPSQITTDDIVRALRTPAPVEEAVPGYRANIADRTQDPGLATLAYNSDAANPGAASARRTGNEVAVNETMTGLAPAGDPGRFRSNLQAGVDARIGAAQSAQEGAQGVFEDLVQALQPVMREATARGSSIRAALADAYDSAQERVRGMYGAIDADGTLLDPTDLVNRATAVDTNLARNDAKRFRPTEAETIREMLPGDRAPLRETGLVNEFNRPIFVENAPANAGNLPALPGAAIGRPGTTVPMSDVSAIRSGLTDDLRAAQGAGNTQQARILSRYVEAIDGYLDENLPEGLRVALDDARAARRDVGERFERPGTALEAILSRREGGGFALDDSAVPSQFAQPDQGRLTDLRAALREAGGDPRLREGLADEVRSAVVQNGLLDKPKALGRYMAERQVLLSEFPELRAQLEQAGASRAALAEAERTASETTRRLTTPGRSAEASYLKDVEDPAAAMRSVIANPDPRKAVADLLATASSPQAKADLRAALWEEVKRTGRLQADSMTGETRWNGKKLRALFDDPKFTAVAEELWADDPQDLASIKQVFGALAGAEGSSRARVPGSSGTPQALSGALDPALTASSIASRARSVSRSQLSPSIAAVDILGTWLRRRSAQVQSRAIDTITAAVVNNPGLAADLLEKYNPATAAARRRMLTQKYGVRATTLLNVLDEAENDDPVLTAIAGE